MFTNRPAKNVRSTPGTEYDTLGEAQASGSSEQISADAYMIRERVQRRLLTEADGEVDLSHIPQMHQMIEALFTKVLAEENYNKTRAAKRLGINRSTLQRRLLDDAYRGRSA